MSGRLKFPNRQTADPMAGGIPHGGSAAQRPAPSPDEFRKTGLLVRGVRSRTRNHSFNLLPAGGGQAA